MKGKSERKIKGKKKENPFSPDDKMKIDKSYDLEGGESRTWKKEQKKNVGYRPSYEREGKK